MKARSLALLLCCVFILPGCAIQAQKYEISAENIQKLKRAGKSSLRVGDFTVGDPKINALTMRGAAFESPYNGSYEAYLKAAITEDLKQASRYAEDSNIEVSGVMLENEFDASGVNVGTATISARIMVNNAGTEKYNKVVSYTHEWESYFAAIQAVPAAQIGYVDTFKNFLNKLYSDDDFINACK